MTSSDELTRKSAYEARSSDGEITGAIGAKDWERFRQTLRFVPEDCESLLDAGCDRGHWLSFVSTRRSIRELQGIDISESRIAEAQASYPGIHFRAGFLERADELVGSHDVVTCLEALEHIPDWEAVLHSLLRVARRRLLITVPYKERIVETVCIHCGNATPLYGHLRSYDESSFPQVAGWRLSFGYIRDRDPNAPLARRLYRLIRPRLSWMVACYDAEGSPRPAAPGLASA